MAAGSRRSAERTRRKNTPVVAVRLRSVWRYLGEATGSLHLRLPVAMKVTY